MYGFNEETRQLAKNKVISNRFYLDNHFVNLGGKDFVLSQFVKNSYINSDKYIAEIQNRVHSIHNYARGRNLVNVFITLTLPSEYHKTKTVTVKNGKFVQVRNHNFIDDEFHTPRAGSKELSKRMRYITNTRIYKSIPKDLRCYFRVTEPHKSGTPHLHISFFIPKEYLYRFVNMIFDKFDFRYNKIEVNVKNPVSYLMKYILKSLDDLRGTDKITDLTLWYIYHGISRIYTSRTLVSLEVYRSLGGRFTMIELTKMIKDKEICAWYDTNTNKLAFISQDTGFADITIWIKSDVNSDLNYNNMRKEFKPTLSKNKKETKKDFIPLEIDDKNYRLFNDGYKERILPTPRYMSDYYLYKYYNELDIEDFEIPLLHYGITQNECVDRGLIDCDLQPLNDYNISF